MYTSYFVIHWRKSPVLLLGLVDLSFMYTREININCNLSLCIKIKTLDDPLWDPPYWCFKKVTPTSLSSKHQFKATSKLKTYDGESLDVGMNLKAKFPTNDKSLDISIFHKDIFLFKGWRIIYLYDTCYASYLGVPVANFLELEFWMVSNWLFAIEILRKKIVHVAIALRCVQKGFS